jgi:hypothetical protein
MRPSDLDPVEHSGAGLPTDQELEDGRAWEWIAVAQDARKGHEDAPATEILIRTAYLMLVRFDFTGAGPREEKSFGSIGRETAHRKRVRAETTIVRDVMNCAAIACETAWPIFDRADVAMCFVTLYQTIQEKRNERALRWTYVDEIDKLTQRSRNRRARILRLKRPVVPGARQIRNSTECHEQRHRQTKLHLCPYAEEIADDHVTQCTCCDACTADCADEI